MLTTIPLKPLCVQEVAGFINPFLDLPQHVSASNCHHQEVLVTSDAIHSACIVDVYGLRPVQSGQLSRDVTNDNDTTKLLGPIIKMRFFTMCVVMPICTHVIDSVRS
jgi:hypothetical protein